MLFTLVSDDDKDLDGDDEDDLDSDDDEHNEQDEDNDDNHGFLTNETLKSDTRLKRSPYRDVVLFCTMRSLI